MALVVLALAVGYCLTPWRVYTAESLITVPPALPKVLDQSGNMRWPYRSGPCASYIEQQILNATRTDVLTGALHRLGPGAWQLKLESEQAAMSDFVLAVEVTRLGTSYQVSIAAHASSAALAAKLANAVAASYLDSATLEQKGWDGQRLTMLSEERDRVQRELGADRGEQQLLNKQMGVAAVGTATPDHFDEDSSRVRDELVKARTAHDEAAARLTAMGAGQTPYTAAITPRPTT